ncbi:hypothetical protein DFH09DRAFT_1083509 [Mycena vulgaris]|nr:hypothetical protein DFH09DRAFT_1083509 [Mycena vulgaris]
MNCTRQRCCRVGGFSEAKPSTHPIEFQFLCSFKAFENIQFHPVVLAVADGIQAPRNSTCSRVWKLNLVKSLEAGLIWSQLRVLILNSVPKSKITCCQSEEVQGLRWQRQHLSSKQCSLQPGGIPKKRMRLKLRKIPIFGSKGKREPATETQRPSSRGTFFLHQSFGGPPTPMESSSAFYLLRCRSAVDKSSLSHWQPLRLVAAHPNPNKLPLLQASIVNEPTRNRVPSRHVIVHHFRVPTQDTSSKAYPPLVQHS